MLYLIIILETGHRSAKFFPYFSFRFAMEESLRAVAATLSPRFNATSVQTRPKPPDEPMINQTFFLFSIVVIKCIFIKKLTHY